MANNLKNFTWFDKKATADIPYQMGGLTALGRTLQGVAAPFQAAYGNQAGYEQLKLNQQQDEANMEFQKYLMKNKIDKAELGIKENDSDFQKVLMAAFIKSNPAVAAQMGLGDNSSLPPSPTKNMLPSGDLASSMFPMTMGKPGMMPQPTMSPQGEPPVSSAPMGDVGFAMSPAGKVYLKNNMYGQKQEQFDQKQWTQFINKNTPTLASSRSTLGMAANGNLRADRALATIQNNPTMTYQDLGNVVGDLAGIYQGGAPTDMGMKHQQYESIQSSLANLKQYVTGNPQDAVPPKIKGKILDVISKLKAVNNTAIKNHFDGQEAGQKKLIDKFPDQWKDFRQKVEGEYATPLGKSYVRTGVNKSGQKVGQLADGTIEVMK